MCFPICCLQCIGWRFRLVYFSLQSIAYNIPKEHLRWMLCGLSFDIVSPLGHNLTIALASKVYFHECTSKPYKTQMCCALVSAAPRLPATFHSHFSCALLPDFAAEVLGWSGCNASANDMFGSRLVSLWSSRLDIVHGPRFIAHLHKFPNTISTLTIRFLTSVNCLCPESV